MWKKYLFTDSLSSFSSMTGSFWILFLLRFAEGVFGNKLILLTGLEQRWFKISFNSVIFIWNINIYHHLNNKLAIIQNQSTSHLLNVCMR